MKTYVLMIAERFPVKHKQAGKLTSFLSQIAGSSKIHTVRMNYELWRKRFLKIESGEACMSIRKWTGKPYRSKQIEIFNFTKDDNIGLEKLETNDMGWLCVGNNILNLQDFATNDGLTLVDFKDWFKDADRSPKALIHFSGFRYGSA